MKDLFKTNLFLREMQKVNYRKDVPGKPLVLFNNFFDLKVSSFFTFEKLFVISFDFEYLL